MKILHVVHGYVPSRGGSQWLTQQLSEIFVARYSDQVTVFTTVADSLDLFHRRDCPALPVGVETINGVTVRRFPVFNRGRLIRKAAAGLTYRLRFPYNDWFRTLESGPIVPGLRRAVAGSGADVVFATAFPLRHVYDALYGARRAGIPVVLLGALHTADVWGFDRPMIYRAIRQADAYIAHTDFERDYVVARGVDAAKVRVIGAGVDAQPFMQADGRRVRQALGWQAQPVVIMLARFVPRKRFDLLLAAMQQVWRQRPDACLLLAGARTSHTAEVERAIAALPAQQRRQVAMVDSFDEVEKPYLVAAADVCVHTATQESFGIALVEAWAGGKPVIGARAAAIPSVIAAGEDGLLFDFPQAESLARAILTLLDDPEQARRMGLRGRQKVLENYTWAIVAQRVHTLYEEVIGARGSM
ncbi:MAG: glycosyltransferase family 4 protein [Caldilineaceae bacterium]|nr:glycosyltransferase family 4 protein [Caldilineaceae bacterium]